MLRLLFSDLAGGSRGDEGAVTSKVKCKHCGKINEFPDSSLTEKKLIVSTGMAPDETLVMVRADPSLTQLKSTVLMQRISMHLPRWTGEPCSFPVLEAFLNSEHVVVIQGMSVQCAARIAMKINAAAAQLIDFSKVRGESE
jgi:hypothetical protein